jgi:hypothetical protein
MTADQQRAIGVPLTQIQTALDDGHAAAVIGAAKDLVEAACKVGLERAGQEVPHDASLPTLFKLTHAATDPYADISGRDLGRSLASAVQRLAELRNAAGTGHGRASVPDVAARDSRLAASSSMAISEFVLSAS